MKFVVAEQFHRRPSGRYRTDGPWSGEKFREDYLVPLIQQAISENKKLLINFDNVSMSASSFIHEAFSGLIVHKHFTKEQLINTLVIESERTAIVESIYEYLNQN